MPLSKTPANMRVKSVQELTSQMDKSWLKEKVLEHGVHFLDARDVPTADFGVEQRRVFEHAGHILNFGRVPLVKVFTGERVRVFEHLHMDVTEETSQSPMRPSNEESRSLLSAKGGSNNLSMLVTFFVSQVFILPHSPSKQLPATGSTARHAATAAWMLLSVSGFLV